MKSKDLFAILSIVWLNEQVNSYFWGFAPVHTTNIPYQNIQNEQAVIEDNNRGDNHDSGEYYDDDYDFGYGDSFEEGNGADDPATPTLEEDNNIAQAEEQRRILWLNFQIIKQLGLPGIPNVTSTVTLPPELKSDLEQEQYQREQEYKYHSDDIKHIFIYGSQYEHCRSNEDYQHSCVTFNFTKTISPFAIADAELWVYKLPSEPGNNHNKTFRLQDVVNVRNPKRDAFFASQNILQTEGWIKFNTNVMGTVRHWLRKYRRNRPHVIDVACTDCSTDCHGSPIALTGSNKPFLMIKMGGGRHDRKKRALEFCPPTIGCCLQSWQVNLKQHSLFRYIVMPETFRPNYCRGDCNMFPADIPYGNMRSSMTFSAGRKSCCYPSRFSKQTVLYHDEEDRLISRELDLVAEDCSCK